MAKTRDKTPNAEAPPDDSMKDSMGEEEDSTGGEEESGVEESNSEEPSFEPPKTTRFAGGPAAQAMGGRRRHVPGRYTRSEAMKRLGVSKTQIGRFVDQGRLTEIKDAERNCVYYEVDEVEALAENNVQDELGAKQIIEAANSIIQAQMNHNEVLSKTTATMIDETGKREAAFMGAFLAATQKMLEQQTTWAMTALERAQKLEVQLDEANETIQKAMDYNQAREIALADAAHRQKRNDAILDTIKSHTPTILALMGKKMGAPVEVAIDPLVTALMATVTEDQATKLYQSGILTQAQMGQLFAVWEAVRSKPSSQPSADSPQPSAVGDQPGNGSASEG